MGAEIEGDAGARLQCCFVCALWGRHRRDFGQVDNSERAPVFFTVPTCQVAYQMVDVTIGAGSGSAWHAPRSNVRLLF